MIVGFTGTRRGLTEAQWRSLTAWVNKHISSDDIVLHGGCLGADDQFDRLVAARGVPRVVFPSTIATQRISPSTLRQRGWCLVRPPRAPLARNAMIVRRAELLIACPYEFHEVWRSGTWATIRYALRSPIEAYVITPNGARYLYTKEKNYHGRQPTTNK